MPSVTPVVNLRRPQVLPFLNPRTLLSLLVLSFFLLNVTVGLLMKETALGYLYLLMIVQVTPLVIALTRRHYTYIAFIMFNHFATLSLAKLNILLNQPGIERVHPEIVSALKEQIFCSVLMQLVYFAFRMLVFQGVAEREKFQELVLTRRHLMYLGAYIALVPLFLNKLPSWFLIVHFLLLSADLLLLFCSRSPGNEWIVRAMKILALFLAAKYFFDTGMLTMMGALITLYMFTGVMQRRRSSLFMAVVLTLLVVSVQSVKGQFRTNIHSSPHLTLGQRYELISDLIDKQFFTGSERNGPVTWDSRMTSLLAGFARAGDDSMERVLSLTPKKVPYWGGETYASIPFMFIPRFLWPGKPSRHFWNKYGRLYGVLSEDDMQTSVGVSYLAEGYMNFGYPGMYGVAIFVGFLFALIERASVLVLGGYFYFPFLLYMLPMLNAATDLGAMLNSLFVMVGVTPLMRPTLLRMAQRDDYS